MEVPLFPNMNMMNMIVSKCEYDAALVDFPPILYLRSYHISFLKDSSRVNPLTYCLEDPVLQFSSPFQILDECGDSGPHLSGGHYIFSAIWTAQSKKTYTSGMGSALTPFLSYVGCITLWNQPQKSSLTTMETALGQ